MKTPVDNSFQPFKFNKNIQNSITSAGYTAPTPIQKESIPVILAGNDVMGLAQTGTGKTAAFVLPMLQRLAEGGRGRVRALILAPTRELAQQTHDAIHVLGKGLNLQSVPLYGGVSIQPQIKKLRTADIVVACPGRLLDHHTRRTVNLSQVEMLVLDEADHMFDIGFLPNVRRILQQLPKQRQSLLFSATMPKEVRELAHEVLKNPVTIKVGDSTPTKTVTQAIFQVSPDLKNELLLKILQTIDAHSVLIFTRTKNRAQLIADFLEEWGYSATSLQGNLSQNKRQRALDDFRKGKLQILVATDIASRGIDVAQISHVINYDIPTTIEAYTHRIGRTGRAAKLGDAFTLVTRAEMGKVRAIERAIGQTIEQRSIPDFDYKAQGSTEADRDHRHRAPKKNFSADSDRPTRSRGKPKTGEYKQRSYGKSSDGDSKTYAPKKNFSGGRSDRPARSGDASSAPKKKYFEKSGDSEFKPYAPKKNFSSARGDRPARADGAPSTYKKKPFGRSEGSDFKPYAPKKKFSDARGDRPERTGNAAPAYKKKEFGRSDDRDFKPYPPKRKFSDARGDRPDRTDGLTSTYKKKPAGRSDGSDFKPYAPKKKFSGERGGRPERSGNSTTADKKKFYGKSEGSDFKPYAPKKKFATARTDRPYSSTGKPAAKKKVFGKPFGSAREAGEGSSYNPLKKRAPTSARPRSNSAAPRDVKKNHGDFQHDRSSAPRNKPGIAAGGQKTLVKKRSTPARKPANY